MSGGWGMLLVIHCPADRPSQILPRARATHDGNSHMYDQTWDRQVVADGVALAVEPRNIII